jgi:hypothetical protein
MSFSSLERGRMKYLAMYAQRDTSQLVTNALKNAKPPVIALDSKMIDVKVTVIVIMREGRSHIISQNHVFTNQQGFRPLTPSLNLTNIS